MSLRNTFERISRRVASAIGTPVAFLIAVAIVVTWATLGPVFGFSDTWQLVINTGTTIVTFLVVFLIQTTQNRDARAVHLKLDELIHVISEARDQLIDAEDLTEEAFDKLDAERKRLRANGPGPDAMHHKK